MRRTVLHARMTLDSVQERLMFRSALVCSSALLLLSALTTPTHAEPRPMLAVLDFVSAGADVTETELSLLTDVSRAEARRTLGSAYTIITQESIQQLLKAHGKTLEQCQGECETETGKLLGAELVVSGRVMKAFGKLKVNLKNLLQKRKQRMRKNRRMLKRELLKSVMEIYEDTLKKKKSSSKNSLTI